MSHREFRTMSQWTRLELHGKLDGHRWFYVESEGLRVPYYWHQRVLSEVPDFDEGVCRNSRRSSLPSGPSLRIWCCETRLTTLPLRTQWCCDCYLNHKYSELCDLTLCAQYDGRSYVGESTILESDTL